MKVTCEASDGTLFNSEIECIRYEVGKDLRELREQGQFEAYIYFGRYPIDEFDKADCFVIKTNKAARALRDYYDNLFSQSEIDYHKTRTPFNDYGFNIEPGLYIYDFTIGHGHWLNVYSELHSLSRIAEKLKVSESDFEAKEV